MLNITKNKTLQNLGIVTLGNIANAALGFFTLIIVSRNLGPSQFGVFSVIFGFFTLFSKGGDLGTNSTLVRYLPFYRAKNDKRSEIKFLGLILGLTYLLSLFTIFLVLPFYKHIASLLNIYDYSSYLLFALFASFFVVLFNTYNAILQSLEKFGQYLFSFTATSVLKFLLIVFLIYSNNLNISNSLYTYLLIPILGYLCSGYFSKNLLGKIPKPNLDKKVLKKATPFLYFMALASFLGALHEQSGVFMSSIVFGDYETGLFSAAAKISVVFGLIGGSVGTVIVPKASKYQDLDNIKKFSKKATLLGLVLALSTLPVIIFPKVFILLSSGKEYLGAAPYLVILSISGAFTVFRSSFSSLFYSLNKASYFALIALANVVFELPLLYFLALNFGVIGIAYGHLITGILVTVFSIFYFKNSIKNVEK